MPGQIVNISWSSLVSEAALKCGDPFFRDFPKNIYSQAVFRAERGVAKRYKFMDRQLSYTNTDGAGIVDIGPLNFNGEWRVEIQHPAATETSEAETVPYKKIQWEQIQNFENLNFLPINAYAIIYNGNRYTLQYTNPSENDVINVWYVSSIAGEEDYEYYDDQGNINLFPVIPNKYYEECLRRAVLYIAELGIAQFDGLKAQRYSRLLGRYTQQEDRMPEQGLERDRPFIQIKAFSTTFPGD